MSDQWKECDMQASAEALTKQLEGRPIPPGYRFDSDHYGARLAAIRHEFTNYEDLLYSLPVCADYMEQHGPIYCDMMEDPDEPARCTIRDAAHDLLQEEANTMAAELYSRWWPEGTP